MLGHLAQKTYVLLKVTTPAHSGIKPYSYAEQSNENGAERNRLSTGKELTASIEANFVNFLIFSVRKLINRADNSRPLLASSQSSSEAEGISEIHNSHKTLGAARQTDT